VSSTLAPVVLVGGWTLAAARQPGGFDSVLGTISDLAGHDATDRWLMSGAIVATGVCHVVTAAALRPGARRGRVLLALGGVATVLVAVFPLPAGGATSDAHRTVALAAFVTLSVWPPFARRTEPAAPWGLRPRVAVTAGGVLGVALVVFVAAVLTDSPQVGRYERVLAAAQACWPAVVVWSASRPGRRRAARAAT
jgi:hypothetical membrane protein